MIHFLSQKYQEYTKSRIVGYKDRIVEPILSSIGGVRIARLAAVCRRRRRRRIRISVPVI